MTKAFFMICFRAFLRICYLPFRLLKPRNKIVFLSRQVNTAGMDFIMLSDEIRRTSPDTEIVILCRTIGKSFFKKIPYFFHMFRQMYHLATSKAAVLDGYCITACLLNHREDLKIYQLWHALGLLKNFAYTALGNAEGTTARTAKIMCMHRGYHKIVCSSEAIVPQIARCYDAEPERMFPVGLPRMDFLTSRKLMDNTREQIFGIYPALNNRKPVILYVPTLRKSGEVSSADLELAVDLNRYNLVIKKHNGFERVVTKSGIFSNLTEFTGLEWLSCADYVITDYSAIIFEAMLADKPVFLYCFDRKSYDVVRGFATPYDSIPAVKCETVKQLITAIENYVPDKAATEEFLEYHASAKNLQSTKALCHTILEEMKGRIVSFEQIKKDYSLQKADYELK